MTAATASRFRPVFAVLGLVLLGSACSDDGPGAADPGADVVIATFEVANGERFSVELATPELIDHAERLLAGDDIAAIPLGTVVRDDPSVNEPWTWHLDPTTFEFARMTIEVCDGIPSDVERAAITSDQYCPWSATIVEVGSAA